MAVNGKGTGVRLHKTVVLVGMMGAGKTAVGREIARRIAVPFLDSDEEIQRAANMTIAEIFARDGEGFFRRREAEVIARLMRERRGILSVGGGAFLNADTRALISKLGVSVWLRADLELLWSRVKGKSTRPLLRTEDPRATLAALMDAREPHYALADLVVDARPGYAIGDMAAKVLETLATRSDVLEGYGG
ncbi:shikimate kinase [Rhodobacteraceae bacterium 2376]|uniref:Shikimate kinase n=1 Tax=Rhabdonatronobacter sediminivivens TaxID=2743469 RepID=A0A7Z0KYY3_9RHOB|nr:shikimate kinase [Rhabdonatronobacter sediminivivens]NYS25789.1 shikimate kinase [Rhabdonatronobacter sediminivivens]